MQKKQVSMLLTIKIVKLLKKACNKVEYLVKRNILVCVTNAQQA